VKGTDKFLGFGDPDEGYAAGFRLHEGGKEGVQLYAVTINHGQEVKTKIAWEKDYATKTRFIVAWMPGKVEYITITSDSRYEKVAVHQDADLPDVGTPRIRMEISIQSWRGQSPLVVDLVKYDAFSY